MSTIKLQLKITVEIESDLDKHLAISQFIENTDYLIPSTEHVYVLSTELVDYDLI